MEMKITGPDADGLLWLRLALESKQGAAFNLGTDRTFMGKIAAEFVGFEFVNREPLCGPEPTREEVRAWWWTSAKGNAPDDILAALRHFRRAPEPVELPQCYGWTVGQWDKALDGAPGEFGVAGDGIDAYRRAYARRIHRLAQPAPKVDPDAEAKDRLWNQLTTLMPGRHGYASPGHAWNALTETQREDWRRAVAKEAGNGTD